MLEAVLGSTNAERVLLFIFARGQGYATEIAQLYETDLSPIQKQLARMERDGLLINKRIGRTLVYEFNPRYAFLKEVKQLLEKALQFAPADLREKFVMSRTRPRKVGKPL